MGEEVSLRPSEASLQVCSNQHVFTGANLSRSHLCSSVPLCMSLTSSLRVSSSSEVFLRLSRVELANDDGLHLRSPVTGEMYILGYHCLLHCLCFVVICVASEQLENRLTGWLHFGGRFWYPELGPTNCPPTVGGQLFGP